MEENTQNSQKTVVSFIVGLIIGGLLVWVFTSAPTTKPATTDTKKTDTASTDVAKTDDTKTEDTTTTDTTDTTKKTDAPVANIGTGSILVDVQNAGTVVALGATTYPGTDGWIAVHSMNGDALGGVLGAARYSTKEGLLPKQVELLKTAPTVKGKTYAVVFHKSDGDRTYSSKTDTVVNGADGKFLGTMFTAN